MSKVQQAITAKIIEHLENGVIPWKKPFNSDDVINSVSKKAYRGINPFLLNMAGFESGEWMTFKQAKDKGGSVKKGEKGTRIIYFNLFEKDDGTKIPVLKNYTVFNIEQTDLPNEFKKIKKNNVIENCENIVKTYPGRPAIKKGKPSYELQRDVVNMPHIDAFINSQSYYSTLFHEYGHSTGHINRLNRKGITEYDRFGSEKYAKEELIAEFTAAMLCGEAGIDEMTVENSAAYIQSWIKRLKEDDNLIITAASQAQKAADYILNIKKAA